MPRQDEAGIERDAVIGQAVGRGQMLDKRPGPVATSTIRQTRIPLLTMLIAVAATHASIRVVLTGDALGVLHQRHAATMKQVATEQAAAAASIARLLEENAGHRARTTVLVHDCNATNQRLSSALAHLAETRANLDSCRATERTCQTERGALGTQLSVTKASVVVLKQNAHAGTADVLAANAARRAAILAQAHADARAQAATATASNLERHVAEQSAEIRTKDRQLAEAGAVHVLAAVQQQRLQETLVACNADVAGARDLLRRKDDHCAAVRANTTIALRERTRRVLELEMRLHECAWNVRGVDPPSAGNGWLETVARGLGVWLAEPATAAVPRHRIQEPAAVAATRVVSNDDAAAVLDLIVSNPGLANQPTVTEVAVEPTTRNTTSATRVVQFHALLRDCSANEACTEAMDFMWTQTVGPVTAELAGMRSRTLSVTGAEPGNYEFTVQVRNLAVASAPVLHARATLQVRQHIVVGIDLGTTYSCAAFIRPSDGRPQAVLAAPEYGHSCIPSHVLFKPGGAGVLVGNVAKAYAARNPSAGTLFDAKRLIGRDGGVGDPGLMDTIKRLRSSFEVTLDATGDGIRSPRMVIPGTDRAVLPEEVSALVLGALKRAAERDLAALGLHQEVLDVVISVPANFDNSQRKATIDAAALAGLTVRKLINEPTAAAFAFVHGQPDVSGDDGKWALVFDWGGGTLDVTSLFIKGPVLQVKAVGGDTQLGGEDVDEALYTTAAAHILAAAHVDVSRYPALARELRLQVEQAKIRLSQLDKVTVAIQSQGREPLRANLTRLDLETAMAPLLHRAMRVVQELLETGGRQAEDFDLVLLVGGTSAIPAVRQELARMFTSTHTVVVDAYDHTQASSVLGAVDASDMQGVVVALGAARAGAYYQARATKGFEPARDLITDVVPLSLRKGYVDWESNPARLVGLTVDFANGWSHGCGSGTVMSSQQATARPDVVVVAVRCAASGATVSAHLSYDRCYRYGRCSFGGAEDIATVLIARNTPYPTSADAAGASLFDGQRGISTTIYEGEYERADRNTLLGSFYVALPLDSKRGTRVDTTFSVDADGILRVTSALRGADGHGGSLELPVATNDGRLTAAQLLSLRQRLADLERDHSLDVTIRAVAGARCWRTLDVIVRGEPTPLCMRVADPTSWPADIHMFCSAHFVAEVDIAQCERLVLGQLTRAPA